jgi:outer membrane receptor for ferrienterochelin and colicins
LLDYSNFISFTNKIMKVLVLFFLLIGCHLGILAQKTYSIAVLKENKALPFAVISIQEENKSYITDSLGKISITLKTGIYTLKIHSYDTKPFLFELNTAIVKNDEPLYFRLSPNEQLIEEVVVSGSLKEVDKLKSTVPVEIYNASFFKKNPTASVFEALQNINGVRPQVNCNICNTGDIHINGLEGPYTMILIDGMPIVSGLSSVYGLSGIPNSLIERMEIVRGPSSALYGSEAIGGIINIITKSVEKAPLFSVDAFTNSWLETSADISLKTKLSKRISGLTGINAFHYDRPIDNNNDNFTDLTLQKRISLFQKFTIDRKSKKAFHIIGRYFYEDRWGGEMNWSPVFRGGDSVYGESIYTNRFELIGNYQLPLKENIHINASYTAHNQNSFYGTTSFMANQKIAFGQITWYKDILRHALVLGTSIRNTQYDDNTVATFSDDTLTAENQPSNVTLPGIFIQDDWTLNERHKLLIGLRYDYSTVHKSILTPRIGYKFNINKNHLIRFNSGTGYRVVSIFTEDHASLTGARKTEISEELRPEQSINVNLNYYGSIYFKNGNQFKIDLSPFYTHFSNKITPDYLSDPTKIIYRNVGGHAISKGVNLNLEFRTENLKLMVGGTYMDVFQVQNGIKTTQLLTEQISGTWSISYVLKKLKLEIDYTGSLYGPMLLPTLGEQDPRPSVSPWWSLQNIQLTYKGLGIFEFYGGVKNILNWVPGKKIPFLIARSHDPFNKLVSFDTDGNALATSENPYALTFDPSYVYGPNQGIRFFLGVRFSLKKG